jgi:hypothetical protein
MPTSPAKSAATRRPSRNTHYVRGHVLEIKARDLLREHGYLVIRAAGSKGKVDLVALRPSRSSRKPMPEVMLVQCKRGERWSMSPGERSELAWLSQRLGCTAVKVTGMVVGHRLTLTWETINADGSIGTYSWGEE